MKPATQARQRPPGARLLRVDRAGGLHHELRADIARHLRAGDLLIANDAATLPASLRGTHRPSGAAIEVRLAGRRTLAADDVRAFTAVVFGAGDHRLRTEDRPPPPALHPGDALQLGPLRATVQATLGHPRFVCLGFEGDADAVWAGIARHGRPVQYAHLPEPLALWDVWTGVAARPVAFEAPSAGFLLDWRLLAALRERGVGFATLTHAAGLSSTGDPALDARWPLAEPYELPATTVAAIAAARGRGGRVIALGTTVVRALEHAAAQPGGLRAGPGLATQRLGPASRRQVVDGIVSGTHEAGSSHHDLLHAFAGPALLRRIDRALEAHGYLTHEFGDSVWIDNPLPGAEMRRGLPSAAGSAATIPPPLHPDPLARHARPTAQDRARRAVRNLRDHHRDDRVRAAD